MKNMAIRINKKVLKSCSLHKYMIFWLSIERIDMKSFYNEGAMHNSKVMCVSVTINAWSPEQSTAGVPQAPSIRFSLDSIRWGSRWCLAGNDPWDDGINSPGTNAKWALEFSIHLKWTLPFLYTIRLNRYWIFWRILQKLAFQLFFETVMLSHSGFLNINLKFRIFKD